MKERNGISHAELLAELRFKQDADGDGLRNFVVSGGKTSGVKTTTGRGDMESLVEESEMAGVIWEDTNEDGTSFDDTHVTMTEEEKGREKA